MTREEAVQAENWQAPAEEGTLLFPPLAHLSELLNTDIRSAVARSGVNFHRPLHAEWGSLLTTSFKHPAARQFWQDRLEEDRELACRILPTISGAVEKFRCFIQSALSQELGCRSARMRLEQLLEQEWPERTLLEHPLVLQSRIADAHVVLIRLVAWRVVDLSLEHWDVLSQTGLEDVVLLENFLPALDPASGRWSAPLEEYLDHLALISGCPSSGNPDQHLAALWEKDSGEGQSPDCKRRLLEHWRWGQTRPTEDAIAALVKATLQAIFARESRIGDFQLNARLLKESFRFAESCGHLQRTLSRNAMPDQVISEIFSVYGTEYRRARAALGRPMTHKP